LFSPRIFFFSVKTPEDIPLSPEKKASTRALARIVFSSSTTAHKKPNASLSLSLSQA